MHKQRNVLNAIPRRERGDVVGSYLHITILLCNRLKIVTAVTFDDVVVEKREQELQRKTRQYN